MIDNLQIVDFNADASNITQIRIRRSDDTIQTFNTEIPGFLSTNITANGTFYAPANTGFDVVTVDVPITGTMEIVNVSLNQDAQHITPSAGYDSIQEVNIPSTRLVEIQERIMPTTQVYKASDYHAYGISQVTVEGFGSKVVDVTTEDLDDAGIRLGSEKTVTPSMVFPDQDLVGFKSFQLPSAMLQNKTVTPSTSEQTISADQFYYGLGQVTVESAAASLEQGAATENGLLTPSTGIGFSSVMVNVQPTGNQKYYWVPVTSSGSGAGAAIFFEDDGLDRVSPILPIHPYLAALQPDDEVYAFIATTYWLSQTYMDRDALCAYLDVDANDGWGWLAMFPTYVKSNDTENEVLTLKVFYGEEDYMYYEIELPYTEPDGGYEYASVGYVLSSTRYSP